MTFIDLWESLHLKLGTTWRKKLQNYHDHSFTGACMNITRIRWKTKMFAVVFYCLCGISWKKLGVRFDYSLHFSPLIKKGLFSKQFLFLKVFLRLIHASWVNNEGGFMWYTDIIKLLNGRCSCSWFQGQVWRQILDSVDEKVDVLYMFKMKKGMFKEKRKELYKINLSLHIKTEQFRWRIKGNLYFLKSISRKLKCSHVIQGHRKTAIFTFSDSPLDLCSDNQKAKQLWIY